MSVLSRWILLVGVAAAAGCGSMAQRAEAALGRGTAGVVTDIPTQDGVCTVAGLDDNANPCATDCCDVHDRCYADSGCGAESWLAGPAAPVCEACNVQVVECLWACAAGPSSAQQQRAPEGSSCTTTSQCSARLVCGHKDDSGTGVCEPGFSGGTGESCTVPVDCQSGLCLYGQCAPVGPRGVAPDNWLHPPPPLPPPPPL